MKFPSDVGARPTVTVETTAGTASAFRVSPRQPARADLLIAAHGDDKRLIRIPTTEPLDSSNQLMPGRSAEAIAEHSLHGKSLPGP